MNAQQAWQATIGQLQMEMPKASFDTWVRNAELVKHEEDTFHIVVRNAYARDWLESRLTSTVVHLLSGIMNCPQQVVFLLQHGDAEQQPASEELPDHSTTNLPTQNGSQALNARYSFENFVVGPNNRLAHAASLAVAENPAVAYNPLFLYGGVGLGKTHLLQAIGHAIQVKGLNVLYVSSEEFTNDLINAIRTHNTCAFRERYRTIDVLLIDDIHFIAGKESTQEEFFHTFNTLHGQNKQIVLTSDRSPKSLVTLEERLRSRFEWGLIADIQPPELETRIAILRSKSERAGRKVPDEILHAIACQIQFNIRELEGALTRVLAYADLSGKSLNLELTSIALVDFLPSNQAIEPARVMSVVADTFGVTREQLLSKDRSHEVVLPRQVAMYLMREEANASLPQIGESLGGRDHTTVMYGCDKVEDMMERDELLRRRVFQIRDSLYNPHQVG
jgi:chromosomal replication initiator protein